MIVKSISQVLGTPQKFTAKDIKDVTIIHSVIEDWVNEFHEAMTTKIRKYGSFNFFKDLAIYLNLISKSESSNKFIYTDIGDIYLNMLNL